MAVDPTTGQAMLFGGYINASDVNSSHPSGAICQGIQVNAVCLYNDTWIWNGSQWTQFTSYIAAAARAHRDGLRCGAQQT